MHEKREGRNINIKGREKIGAGSVVHLKIFIHFIKQISCLIKLHKTNTNKKYLMLRPNKSKSID